jgi:hypothetical protein
VAYGKYTFLTLWVVSSTLLTHSFSIKYTDEKSVNIQGADDKLGQFLDQDIEASASHRNVLRHFLKSCSSLVSPNVNKPLIFTKISR